MRLLVIAQTVDVKNPVLGFFHEWLVALAPSFTSLQVICLYEGEHMLPETVQVHSLGKERGEKHSLLYAIRFYHTLWRLRGSYDAVFVHMNEEYVLLAGWIWMIQKIPVFMWRNHYAGSLRTWLASLFVTKTLCTSRYSYTARFKKNILMPVGVDIERFPFSPATHKPRTMLFLARMAPSKQPELLIDALGLLAKKGISFTATFCGDPAPGDDAYYESLKDRAAYNGVDRRVFFLKGVPHAQTSSLFSTHEIFVNTSRSGMFDKTLFEAAATGALVVASSLDFADSVPEELSFTDADPNDLCLKLENLIGSSEEHKQALRKNLREYAEKQSLSELSQQISSVILTSV